jgi:hypothetical protein
MIPGAKLFGRLLLLGVMLLSGMAFADDNDDHGEGGRVPLPKEIEAKGDQCVQPEDEMRRNHMNYILHQRDKTMHEGIRTTQYSLKECINCHVQPGSDGQPVSIKSTDHFCNGCHEYAAVSVDCFQCHSSQPEEASPHAAEVDDSALRNMLRAQIGQE